LSTCWDLVLICIRNYRVDFNGECPTLHVNFLHLLSILKPFKYIKGNEHEFHELLNKNRNSNFIMQNYFHLTKLSQNIFSAKSIIHGNLQKLNLIIYSYDFEDYVFCKFLIYFNLHMKYLWTLCFYCYA